jgi:hypothetical protein
MKGQNVLRLAGALALATLLASGVALAQGPGPQDATDALSTAFTYQGRLLDGGEPADGQYDFQFTLYDHYESGSQVGPVVELGDKEVTNGYFTVELDFGDVFDGTALWLKVGVRPWDSVDPYTTLDPRQPLTAAPYALYARSTGALQGYPVADTDPAMN